MLCIRIFEWKRVNPKHVCLNTANVWPFEFPKYFNQIDMIIFDHLKYKNLKHRLRLTTIKFYFILGNRIADKP